MNPATLDLLARLVDEWDGSVIGSPVQLAHDGRRTAEAAGLDWHDLGWPATGVGLAKLLDHHGDDLAAAGLVYVHTLEAPGQPEWLALTAHSCDWAARHDHGGPLLTAVTSPLAPKLAALLRWLTAADGTWTGNFYALHRAWKAMPNRGGLPGQTWPKSPDRLADLLRLALVELAADGLTVEVSPVGVTVTRTTPAQLAA